MIRDQAGYGAAPHESEAQRAEASCVKPRDGAASPRVLAWLPPVDLLRIPEASPWLAARPDALRRAGRRCNRGPSSLIHAHNYGKPRQHWASGRLLGYFGCWSPKLGDFGSARYEKDVAAQEPLQGTAAYLAPEARCFLCDSLRNWGILITSPFKRCAATNRRAQSIFGRLALWSISF